MENMKIKINAEVDQDSIREIETQIDELQKKLQDIKVGFKIAENNLIHIDGEVEKEELQPMPTNINKYPHASELKLIYKINKPQIKNEVFDYIYNLIHFHANNGYKSTFPIKIDNNSQLCKFFHPEYRYEVEKIMKDRGYNLDFSGIDHESMYMIIQW